MIKFCLDTVRLFNEQYRDNNDVDNDDNEM